MNWFDWLIIIVFILTHLWTVRRFSVSSPASGTSPETPRETHEDQEVEAIQGVMVRLAAENQQWERKYARLETDYQAMMTKLTETEQRLERRTQALRACRELLTQKQGIEDSGEMLP